ncbi:MAG: hypothetical protein P4L91_03470 [Burkholderiaceae bacterium]|nr:hypothetical protein [Burkholderiaceae bacterium]
MTPQGMISLQWKRHTAENPAALDWLDIFILLFMRFHGVASMRREAVFVSYNKLLARQHFSLNFVENCVFCCAEMTFWHLRNCDKKMT